MDIRKKFGNVNSNVDKKIERDWKNILGMDFNSKNGDSYRKFLSGFGIKFEVRNKNQENQFTEISKDELKNLRNIIINIGIELDNGTIEIIEKKK